MDHGYIERRQVIERYVTDRLSTTERIAFEEHYIACEQCLDRLEEAEETRARHGRAGNGPFRCSLIGVRSDIATIPPAARPQVVNPNAFVIPVFQLQPAGKGADPTPVAARGRFVLCLEFSADARAARFDAAVSDDAGRIVSTADGVVPPISGSLGLTLHSSALRSGCYVVTVEGRSAAGECIENLRFAFRFVSASAEAAGSFQ
jgi:hypothetical protein